MPTDGPLWAFEGTSPTVAPDAWVAPTACVIGDVVLGARSSVWFGCVLRGDTHHIRVGAGSNIQDGTIIHIATGAFPCLIGRDVLVGHACIIGMGATVLDGAVIAEGGMLAAGGLLTPGKRIGPNELWAGSPARLKRVMSAEERASWDGGAQHYVELAQRFRAGLVPAR